MRLLLLIILGWSLPLMAQSSQEADKADALIRARKHQEAVPHIQKVLADDPDNSRWNYFMALGLHLGGNLDEAHPYYKKVQKSSAYYPGTLYNLACYESVKGRPKKAWAYLQESYSYGVSDRKAILEDDDLIAVRQLPEFFMPADMEDREVELSDGSVWKIKVIEPVGKTPVKGVVLGFASGRQSDLAVTSGLNNHWGPALAMKGWRIVSPIRPDGVSWFSPQGKALLSELMVSLSEAFANKGPFQVAGYLDGGALAYLAASLKPVLVKNLILVPGVPRSDMSDTELARLKDVSVYSYIGTGMSAWWEAEIRKNHQRLEGLGIQSELVNEDYNTRRFLNLRRGVMAQHFAPLK